MLLKSNKAFSLIEVLISAGVVAASITFIFRAFTISLTTAQLSEDITLGCYAAEERLWQIETKGSPESSGRIRLNNKDFKWSYSMSNTADPLLKRIDFSISWPEKRERDYIMEFSRYILTQ